MCPSTLQSDSTHQGKLFAHTLGSGTSIPEWCVANVVWIFSNYLLPLHLVTWHVSTKKTRYFLESFYNIDMMNCRKSGETKFSLNANLSQGKNGALVLGLTYSLLPIYHSKFRTLLWLLQYRNSFCSIFFNTLSAVHYIMKKYRSCHLVQQNSQNEFETGKLKVMSMNGIIVTSLAGLRVNAASYGRP